MSEAELREVWRDAATRVGGVPLTGIARNGLSFSVEVPPSRAIVDTVETEVGNRTRVRLPISGGAPPGFAVSPEGVLTRLLKPLGFVQDIEIGDARFDAMYRVKGFPVAAVKQLLVDEVVERMVHQPHLRLWVVPSMMLHFRVPSGVSFLEVWSEGRVRSAQRLVDMVEIVRTVARGLDPVGAARPVGEMEIDALAERVTREGTVIVDPWASGVRWDLDVPRLQAIRELGARGAPESIPALVATLDDDSAEVTAAAADALAEVGDPRCIPALVRTLGDLRDLGDDRRVRDHAAEALDRLGEGEVARAVAAALEGDPDRLRPHLPRFRAELLQALMEVGASWELEARVHAVRALGRIGAREALPLLRDATKSMGMRTKYSTAAREAIREIEAQASLPRAAGTAPADTGVAADTLPRPAGGPTDRTSDRLPRPADGGDG